MTALLSDIARRLKAACTITSNDTLDMRCAVWTGGAIDPGEADAIFDLNTVVKSSERDWVDFFVEAMKQYVVHQQVPEGYVDDAKATWLIERIDHDGRVESLGELELLVEIVEDAPEGLKVYALEQIRIAVLTGRGPTRTGASPDPGSINATEVALLRRLLYGQACDGPAMISRAEADMLFEIENATLGAANAPEWRTLFVEAVGKHLMAHGDEKVRLTIISAESGRQISV